MADNSPRKKAIHSSGPRFLTTSINWYFSPPLNLTPDESWGIYLTHRHAISFFFLACFLHVFLCRTVLILFLFNLHKLKKEIPAIIHAPCGCVTKATKINVTFTLIVLPRMDK